MQFKVESVESGIKYLDFYLDFKRIKIYGARYQKQFQVKSFDTFNLVESVHSNLVRKMI